MTKEELSEKRGRVIKSLNDVGAILSLDEMYIDELEKENKDLRDNYDQFKAIAEPEIERLKKENAELKDKFKITKAVDESFALQTVQLIKAKEIIKELLDTQSQLDPYRDIFKDRVLKAEQFLKEM